MVEGSLCYLIRPGPIITDAVEVLKVGIDPMEHNPCKNETNGEIDDGYGPSAIWQSRGPKRGKGGNIPKKAS